MSDIFYQSVMDSLPRHVQIAYYTFSAQERALLTSFFDADTWEFEFVGFIDPETGRATKPVDVYKLEALGILDEEYRRYEREMRVQRVNDIKEMLRLK